MPRLTDSRDAPETVMLTFNGEPLAAVPGESIAATLAAAGKLALRKDSRGQDRGMLCGMGACFECRVSIDGGAAKRACLTPVTDGMRVASLSYHESLPKAAASSEPEATPKSIRCGIAVIGTGPAGMSAAIELAEAGKQVVVLDERHAAGGQFYKQKIAALRDAGKSDSQYVQGAALIERLQRSGAEVLQGVSVWGAFRNGSGNLELNATGSAGEEPKQSIRVTAENLIVATGAYESVPPFPGWTLPGVMTTGSAQGLLRAYRVSPGQRVLIAGNGPLNLQLACELLSAGVDVVAVAESAPVAFPNRLVSAVAATVSDARLIARGLQYLRTLKRRNVQVFNAHHVHSATGDSSIAAASIAAINDAGQLDESSAKEFSVDTLCVGYALRPSSELLSALGCRMTEAVAGAAAPLRDDTGQTSEMGVFAVGDGAALGGARVAEVEGRLVASAILKKVSTRRDVRSIRRHRRFQRHLWKLYRAPDVEPWTRDTVICRCESVTAGVLKGFIADGIVDLGALKRHSRAGMGMCQGRYCSKTIRAMLIVADSPPTARNPVKPATLADLATEKSEWRGYREATHNIQSRVTETGKNLTRSDVDVLVIGAGVIGAAAALHLARDSVDVMLLDGGTANGGASGGNAGSLHLQLLPFDFDASTSTVQSAAVRTLALQRLGIERWQKLEQELGVDFELSMSGGMMLADSKESFESLVQKVALEKQVGVDTEILSAGETRALLPATGEHIVGSAFCAGEGKINPLTATPALINAAVSAGAALSEQTAALQIEKDDGGYSVTTNRGVIRCQRMVIAAGAWAGEVAAMFGVRLPMKVAPQQMLVTQAVEPTIPCLLALAGRHLTLKQAANGNVLIGGGWPADIDPKTGRTVVLRDSLEGNAWAALRAVPALGGLEVIRSWAAMGVYIDGAPIIGALPGHPNVFTAVGANGYTMGPILGQVLADLVKGRDSGVDIMPFGLDRFT